MDPKSIETNLLLSIDTMGQRYGMLPSEIMLKASTFDLVIMDMAMTYEKHINDSSKEGYIPPVSTEELIKIKERT